MLRSALVVAVLSAPPGAAAHAEELWLFPPSVVCTSPGALAEFQHAEDVRDERQQEALLKSECLRLGDRVSFSLIEMGERDALVRIYIGDQSFRVWAKTAALPLLCLQGRC